MLFWTVSPRTTGVRAARSVLPCLAGLDPADGYMGTDPSTTRIEFPFCSETDNFKTEHHTKRHERGATARVWDSCLASATSEH
jgi:hypothetical protein